MSEYAGLSIRLSRREFERLIELAQRDLRHPRDQAVYLLRQAMVSDAGDVPEENANRDAMDSDPQRAAVARDFSCPSETTALCLRQGRQTETGPTTLRRKER